MNRQREKEKKLAVAVDDFWTHACINPSIDQSICEDENTIINDNNDELESLGEQRLIYIYEICEALNGEVSVLVALMEGRRNTMEEMSRL